MRPYIVCLCGSTRFKGVFEEVTRQETMVGRIVLAPGVYGHADQIVMDEETKRMLDQLHFRKIDMADEVLVINVDGYIGDSTRREIEYAIRKNIPVRYLEENRRSRSFRNRAVIVSQD